MTLTFTIDDANVPAWSAQFESRTPRRRDEKDSTKFTETQVEHVTRALNALLSAEGTAARKFAADQAIATAEKDGDDAALSAALLARRKLG